ncbi:MAG: transglycosylase SLT domain-containing protein, partial [Rhodocyclaceae bacterium]|nr:transglycosylase SLT domain-containing protein [Rhodocyclaceae bacterium]
MNWPYSFKSSLLVVLTAATMPAFAQETERPRWPTLFEEARAYEHGEGVGKDLARAIELYCQEARTGNAEAFYALGWIHANGRGRPRDEALAAYFFLQAARRGVSIPEGLLKTLGVPSDEVPSCLRPVTEIAEANPEDADGDLLPEDQRKRQLAELIKRLAPEYGVEPRLALAIAATESNFQPLAVSPKNAQGLMQLIPDTAQ